MQCQWEFHATSYIEICTSELEIIFNSHNNSPLSSIQIGSVDSSSLISPSTPTNKPKPTRRSTTPQKKKAPSPGTGASPGASGGAKSAAAKARDEARKKMLEEKKRNMMKMKKEQAAKAASGDGDSGAIFVEF